MCIRDRTWSVDVVSAPGKGGIDLFIGLGDCTTQAEIDGRLTGDKGTDAFSFLLVCSSSSQGLASAYLICVVEEPHVTGYAPMVSCVG